MNGTDHNYADDVLSVEDDSGLNTPHDFGQQFLLLLKKHTEYACVEFIPGRDDVVTIMASGNTIQKNEHLDDRIEVYCNTVQHMRDFICAQIDNYKKVKGDRIDFAQHIKEWDEHKPVWDGKEDVWSFKIKVLEYYREMYRRLMKFSNCMNYFKGSTGITGS